MAVNGCCGRTFRERFPQIMEGTLDTFLDQWCKGMFLSLKTDGKTQESVSPKMETESWSGGCWTLNISESLNDAVESSLYSILEHGGGTRRYCLSPKACEGILRRAKERGKVLPKALEETLMKMASVQNGGWYKVTGALDQGKVVMEPCMMSEDTFAVSQENHMDIATNVAPPLKSRDYKAPHAVCYEEPTIYDMKQHHAPSEINVVSWKERDRLAPIMNNMTGTLAASDYKGPSFVGYMENQKDDHES